MLAGVTPIRRPVSVLPASQLRACHGESFAVAVDVAVWEEVETIVETVVQRLGGPTVLVRGSRTNAGPL